MITESRQTFNDYMGSSCGLSTYRDTYKPCWNIFPPIMYSQPPAFELSDVAHVKVRQFPLIPLGPHRRLELEAAGPARPVLGPGLGTRNLNTERLLDKKPILRTPNPRDIIYNDSSCLLEKRKRGQRSVHTKMMTNAENSDEKVLHVKEEILDALIKEATWVTATQRASKEAAMPILPVETPRTTFEENADMVKLRPHRYEDAAGEWQRVAPLWERAQSRPRTDKWLTGAIEGTKPRAKHPRRLSTNKQIDVEDKILKLIQGQKLPKAYEKPCPGYAGFVPRSPVDVPLEGTVNRPNFETVMKASYRNLSPHYNNRGTSAHLGPLSQLVTLTYPYNPFNKMEKREV